MHDFPRVNMRLLATSQSLRSILACTGFQWRAHLCIWVAAGLLGTYNSAQQDFWQVRQRNGLGNKLRAQFVLTTNFNYHLGYQTGSMIRLALGWHVAS